MSRLGGLGKQPYLIPGFLGEEAFKEKLPSLTEPQNMNMSPDNPWLEDFHFLFEEGSPPFFKGTCVSFRGCNLHTCSKVTVGEDSCLQATLLRQLEVFNLLVILCRLILRTVRHRAIPFSDLEVEEISEIINRKQRNWNKNKLNHEKKKKNYTWVVKSALILTLNDQVFFFFAAQWPNKGCQETQATDWW